MAGCRSLTEQEIQDVSDVIHHPRDRALFITGVRTGFRISELLSLRVQDVSVNGKLVPRLKVFKRNVKGKTKSRDIVLHPEAKEAIEEWLKVLGDVPPDTFLFQSREGENSAISRYQAHKVLKDAYFRAGVGGAVATHSMRKSFAKKVFENLKHNLVATKEALGHSSVLNTVKYLDVYQDDIDKAVLE